MKRPEDRHAILRPSPRAAKKWRIELPGETPDERKKTIDFGQSGASDFTRHKDAARMLRYAIRHGAMITERDAWLVGHAKDARLDPRNKGFDKNLYDRVIRAALNITESSREDWSDVTRPGFWSRWLTWSHPDVDQARRFIKRKFHVDVRRPKNT